LLADIQSRYRKMKKENDNREGAKKTKNRKKHRKNSAVFAPSRLKKRLGNKSIKRYEKFEDFLSVCKKFFRCRTKYKAERSLSSPKTFICTKNQ
jgi:hypothetical protein